MSRSFFRCEAAFLLIVLGSSAQQVTMLLLTLAALVAFTPRAHATAKTTGLLPLTVALDKPAYTGESLWIIAAAGRKNVRYPFRAAMEDIGCNRLEMNRNGTPLTPVHISGTANLGGILCGSAAPSGSPDSRLPLHVLFPFRRAGTYSVRWTELAPNASGELESVAQSEWMTFQVRPATPKQREQWLRTLLAKPPQDPGHLAGDFLPSLLAAAPDPRVLQTFVNYLHADNALVSGMASAALERFPLSEVRQAVAETIVQHGPSDQLAYFATYHRGWTREDQSRIVHATIPYLQPSHSGRAAESSTPYAPTQNSAAFTLLRFIFYVPNHTWPADPELESLADSEVVRVAPSVIASGDPRTVQELAEYLGAIQPSARAHELLLQIAERPDTAGEQAKICLNWHR